MFGYHPCFRQYLHQRNYMGCVQMMKEKRYRNKEKAGKVRRELEMRRIRDKQMRLEHRMELDKINRQSGY